MTDGYGAVAAIPTLSGAAGCRGGRSEAGLSRRALGIRQATGGPAFDAGIDWREDVGTGVVDAF